MYTSAEEYFKKIYQITSSNFPTLALLLPSTETIYNIDLYNRIVEAPEYLSVQTDHFAETVYFKFNRYHDNMDLLDTVCIIQYQHEKQGEKHFYAVPFYDTYHLNKEGVSDEDRGKVLIPWCISGNATQYSGKITFAIHFYKVDETGGKLIYSLNTLPATSQILYGLDKESVIEEEMIASEYEQIIARLNNIEKDFQIYWDEA